MTKGMFATIAAAEGGEVEVVVPSSRWDGVHPREVSTDEEGEEHYDDEDEYYSAVSPFDTSNTWLDREIMKGDEDDASTIVPPPSKITPWKQKILSWHHSVRAYWRNHRVTCVWILIYAVANVVAFYYKASVYAFDPKHETARAVFGTCVVVARGAAMCLNLNACLILLPLCRHLWTFVQSAPPILCFGCSSSQSDGSDTPKPKRLHWTSWLPLDQWVLIHRVIGINFLYWTLVHCSAHACDFYRFAHHPNEEDLYQLLHKEAFIPTDPAGRWKLLLRQPAAITGIIMAVCMLAAYPCVLLHRRLGFDLFWYSHHLLLVVLVALLFHGMGQMLEPQQSIYWVGVPLLLYLIPKIWREIAGMCNSRAKVHVLELAVKPGNVIQLRITKPPRWQKRLRAGMYANLNIPYLSSTQWHPFTVSSAPSDDFLEFHIRPVGDWTMALYKLAATLTAMDKVAGPPTLQDIQEAGLFSADESQPMYTTSNVKTTKRTMEVDIARSSVPRSSTLWLWDVGSSIINLGAATNVASTTEKALHSGYSSTEGTSSWCTTANAIPQHGDCTMTAAKAPFQLQHLVVKLDGPFGSPSQGYSQHRMVVLVGAGIGVTPMVSVLKELLANPGKMQRTYLIWSFRERRALDWFESLITDVLEKQAQGQRRQGSVSQQQKPMKAPVLQLRFFVTAAPAQPDEERKDKGLSIAFGRRPCWYKELSRVHRHIRALDYNKCGVFVCGPNSMTTRIREVSFRISRDDPDFHFYCRQESFGV